MIAILIILCVLLAANIIINIFAYLKAQENNHQNHVALLAHINKAKFDILERTDEVDNKLVRSLLKEAPNRIVSKGISILNKIVS